MNTVLNLFLSYLCSFLRWYLYNPGYTGIVFPEKSIPSVSLLSLSRCASGAICGSRRRPGSPIHTLSLLLHLDGWGAICCKGSSTVSEYETPYHTNASLLSFPFILFFFSFCLL